VFCDKIIIGGNMDRQSKINDFVFALEGLSSSVIPKCFEISSTHLELLEDEIINYINANYPAIIFTKTELKDLIEKVYQKKHYHLKKSIDSNIGLMKYKLEDVDVDLEQIIQEEIAKYKTLFTSISAGTNISYLGLVDECTRNVMAMLIRKNNSISFAKKTGQVSDYIYQLVNDSFFRVMVALGDYFLDNGVLPIEEDFKFENPGKSKTKTEEFF